MKKYSAVLVASVLALFVSCSSSPVEQWYSVYVSSQGSDTNDGASGLSPVQSLAKGMYLAQIHRASYLNVSGDYQLTPDPNGAGLSITNAASLTISGGWLADFTAIAAPSVMDGQNACTYDFLIENSSGLTVSNFIFTGANNDVQDAGTAIAGAGVAVYDSDYVYLKCVASNNYSYFYGGGIGLYACDNCSVHADLYDNQAGSLGGGFYSYIGKSNIYDLNCRGNTSYNGGGVYLAYHSDSAMTATVSQNTANYQGAGVYVSGSRDNALTGSITSNDSTSYDGGGIYVNGCRDNTLSFVMTYNTAARDGGGYYFDTTSSNNTIYGTIQSNRCNTAGLSCHGGGVCYAAAGLGNTVDSYVVINDNFNGPSGWTVDNIYTN